MEYLGPLAIATTNGELTNDVVLARDTVVHHEQAIRDAIEQWVRNVNADFYTVKPKAILGSLWLNLSALYISERKFEEGALAVEKAREQYSTIMELWSFSLGLPSVRLAAVMYNASALLYVQGSIDDSAHYCSLAKQILDDVEEKDRDESYVVVSHAARKLAEVLVFEAVRRL